MAIVRVGTDDTRRTAWRSVLAVRLTSSVGSAALRRPTVKSCPEANCTAPSPAEMAIAPKIPLILCDIASPRLLWRTRRLNVGLRTAAFGRVDHEKKIEQPGTSSLAASLVYSRLFPPAPLTGEHRARPW